MKFKIILVCLVAMFLIACTPIQEELAESIEKPVNEEITKEPVEEETPTAEPVDEEIIEDEIPVVEGKIFLGETKIINGQEVYLEDIDSDGTILMYLNGERFRLYGTKSPYIVQNLRVIATEFNMGFDDAYIILDIEPLVLEENQYFICKGDYATVNGLNYILKEVKSTGTVMITVEGTNIINEGIAKTQTEELESAEVSISEYFYRNDQCAILNIVPF